MSVDKLIVGLSGMPGSGKSIVVNVAKSKGFRIIVMGDVIREETQRRGLMLTSKNVGEVMLDLRSKEGKSVIAKRCIPKIKEITNGKIIIDGLRSLFELELFKNHFSTVNLIAMHSSPETRYKRLNERRRCDDSTDRIVFQERDRRELSVGLGDVIAMADFILINENNMEEIKIKSAETLQRIEKKWMK